LGMCGEGFVFFWEVWFVFGGGGGGGGERLIVRMGDK